MVRMVDDSNSNSKKRIDSTDADKSQDDHLYSDVDSSQNAQHHTLGKQPTQAAAGNHNHDSRYAFSSHGHTSDDLPPVIIPDEVVIQPTAPDTPEEGQLWVDSSIPDAKVQVVDATWETDAVAITSTTSAHPAKWGMPVFTAPSDGVIMVIANMDIDASGLLNNRWAEWRLRVYDSIDTLVNGQLVRDDRTRVYTLMNHCVAQVTAGETYTIRHYLSLSHANGTTFTASIPQVDVVFLPFADYLALTIETDP